MRAIAYLQAYDGIWNPQVEDLHDAKALSIPLVVPW